MEITGIGAAVFGIAALAVWGAPVSAGEMKTTVLVRAVSRDAKVIGDKVGGARITIRDAVTGAVLAQGMQRGSTGDTRRIMVEPHRRGAVVYRTPGTAGFLAELSLRKPTVVEISAEGPLGTPQSTQKVTKTLLLVPGQDVLGEGVLLEIHGFTVALLEPGEKTEFGVGGGDKGPRRIDDDLRVPHGARRALGRRPDHPRRAAGAG